LRKHCKVITFFLLINLRCWLKEASLTTFAKLSTIKIGQITHAYSARLRIFPSPMPYFQMAIIRRNHAQNNAIRSSLIPAFLKWNDWMHKKGSTFHNEHTKFQATACTFTFLSIPSFIFGRATKSSIHNKSSILKDLAWREEEQGIFQNLLYKGKWTEITVLCQNSKGYAEYPKSATTFEVGHDSEILQYFSTLKEAKEYAERYFIQQIKQENYSTKKKSLLLLSKCRSRIANHAQILLALVQDWILSFYWYWRWSSIPYGNNSSHRFKIYSKFGTSYE